VFENRMLRRIFGPKRDEVTGGWRKLHNEELNNLYSSPNIIRIIKSRRMRWTVTHTGEMRNAYNFFIGKPEGKKHSEDLGICRSIILKWILRKLCQAVDWINLAQVETCGGLL
jgi:hypothetical protein